jgi:hypothetical protein
MPAYLPAILKLWRDGLIPSGSVVHLDIGHEAGCRYFRDGICTCRPFASVRQVAA